MAGKSPYRIKKPELKFLLWEVIREYLFRASKRGFLECEFEERYRAGFRRKPTSGEIEEFMTLAKNECMGLLTRKLDAAKTALKGVKGAREFIERIERLEEPIEEAPARKK